jgi:hypothetical protein
MGSIAEAFLEAGAGTVLAARWEVDDETAGEFLEGFYTSLMKGAQRSTAVRSAMRSMITRGHRASRVWAGFQLFGEGGSLSAVDGEADDRSGHPWLVCLGVIAAGTTVLWLGWRKVQIRA